MVINTHHGLFQYSDRKNVSYTFIFKALTCTFISFSFVSIISLLEGFGSLGVSCSIYDVEVSGAHSHGIATIIITTKYLL